MHIQALILTRDEQHHVADCIDSVRPYVDGVSIFDTGSRDATLETARSHGARCHRIPWREHFAEARNAALEKTEADWIFVLDADERLDPNSGRDLRDALAMAATSVSALYLQVRTYTEDVEALGYASLATGDAPCHGAHGFVPEIQPRLLRAQGGLHYVGRVCERLCSAEGTALPLAAPPQGIVHHLRDVEAPERRRQRAQLRLRLALQEVVENNEATACGRLGVLLNQQRCWRAGLTYLRAAEKRGARNPALSLQAGVAQLELGLVDGAILSLRQACRELVSHPEVSAQLARALLRRETTEPPGEAGALLESALEQAPEMDVAMLQQALWHRRRGELGEARACLEALLDRNPVHAPALRELGAVALLQGRLTEAERLLLHTCRLRPGDADCWNNLGCALERLGRWNEARRAFQRAARLAPGNSRLLGNLCVAHAACDDLESLRSTAASMLACAQAPSEALRRLQERCLDAGWLEALVHLESWAVEAGWMSRESRVLAAPPARTT